MSVRLLACAVFGLVLAAGPVTADDPPKPKPGTTDHILAALRQPVSFERVEEHTLGEILDHLSEKYDLTFTISDETFKAANEQNPRQVRPGTLPNRVKGMTLHRFLSLALEGVKGTYLVRKGYIEIIQIEFAAKETQNALRDDRDYPHFLRLKEPLVSAAYKEKPLNEALADLAEEYDLTVVVSPQAGDARMGFVNARLLNLPADKAVELLALQADLRVVRRGTAYLVTSKDHADAMAGEKIEKERQQIELGWMRKGPPPPAPAPKPEPAPEPKKEP
jgi:hypothetical protein